MYLIYVFILFELCLNSCINQFMYEFMYLSFLNTCTYYFLTIKLFLCFYSLLFRDMSFAISIL